VLELLGKGRIGVNLQRFRPDILDKAQQGEYRRQLGLPAEGTAVGFVGRPVIEKGILDLMEAWSMVLEAVPTAYLLVVAAKLASERSDFKVHMLPEGDWSKPSTWWTLYRKVRLLLRAEEFDLISLFFPI
jgi:glycosyltransferase involved in cell wall biosynthesis